MSKGRVEAFTDGVIAIIFDNISIGYKVAR